MFTGIIETTARIDSKENIGHNVRIAIELDKKWKLKLGDSVAVAGVCLTVAEIKKNTKNNLYFFDMIPETLEKTTFGKNIYPIVNIERPMVYGARVHGHIVSGHVNCVGTVTKISDDKRGYRIEIAYPKKFKKYVIEKGSIVINGTSLTIAEVKNSASVASLAVALVPHTLKVTTLSNLEKGDIVNLEFDLSDKK
ncbi:MAG: riboflavin synthase [bacterium]